MERVAVVIPLLRVLLSMAKHYQISRFCIRPLRIVLMVIIGAAVWHLIPKDISISPLVIGETGIKTHRMLVEMEEKYTG